MTYRLIYLTMSRLKIFKPNPCKSITERLTITWVVSVIIFITFDILWCSMTTFRSMSFIGTYVYAVFTGLIISFPTALFPRQPFIQLLLWIAVLLLLVANMMYFRTYFTAIPASSYLLAGNLSDFKASVVDSFAYTDVILFIITGIGYYLLVKSDICMPRIKYYFKAFTITAVAALLVTLPYGGLKKHIDNLTNQCYYTNCPPVVYTIFGKTASDILTTRDRLSSNDSLSVINWMNRHNRYTLHDFSVQNPRKNLVFIYLESFESWPIEKKVEGQEITPFINSVINDSTTFYAPNVVTQVGNGRSIDAQLLTLAGMLPMENEVYSMTRYDNTFFSLPKAMKENDKSVKTYLLSGDKGGVWNQALVARAFGIDTLIDAHHWKITDKIGNPPKLSDDALFCQTIENMKKGEIFPENENAFVQIVAYSSHNPFRIPENKRHISLKNKYPSKLADYIIAINYVDNSLGQLIKYLKTRPDYDNTAIVIVGDHEGLAKYRDEIRSDKIGKSLVDSRQLTPFIIINSPIKGRLNSIMGQVDIYPTLLDIMNLNDYAWRGMGLSILSPFHPKAAVGSQKNIIADKTVNDSVIEHLSEAKKVSNIILKFDMLNSRN